MPPAMLSNPAWNAQIFRRGKTDDWPLPFAATFIPPLIRKRAGQVEAFNRPKYFSEPLPLPCFNRAAIQSKVFAHIAGV